VEVAQLLDELGRLLFDSQRFAEAEPVYRRSLTTWARLVGPGNSLLASSYDSLAVVLASLTRYPEAEELYRKALKLRDQDDLDNLHNLTLVLEAQEKFKDAEPVYRRALAIVDVPNPEDTERLTDLLSGYAAVLRQLKRPAEAARIEARLKGMPQPARPKAPPVAAKQVK